MPYDLVRQLNHNASTHILVNQKVSEKIQTPDSVKNREEGYPLTTGEIKIVCYIGDAVSDLQRLLHSKRSSICKYPLQIPKPSTSIKNL